MLLGVFYLMIKAFETQKVSLSIYAGIICMLLVSTHFFDALIVYPILILFILLRFLLSGNLEKLKNDAKLFIVMFLISAISPLYNFWASMVNPVFHEHAWKAAITLSPRFIWYVGLFGFLFVFAVLGILKVLQENKSVMLERKLFLVVWAMAIPFMIYFPISFQRRLIEGVHVPMSLLASIGIVFLINKFKLDRRLASSILLILLIPGTLTVLSFDIGYLGENSRNQSVAGFLDKEIYTAIMWLKENTEREEIILADFEIGNYIPAISGNTVYIGHSPETMNFWGKWALVKAFFDFQADDNSRREFLKTTGINYIVYSWKERRIGGFNIYQAPYLKNVYSNSEVSIFKAEL